MFLCLTPHAVFTEEINFGPVSSSDMFNNLSARKLKTVFRI